MDKELVKADRELLSNLLDGSIYKYHKAIRSSKKYGIRWIITFYQVIPEDFMNALKALPCNYPIYSSS